MRNNTLLLLVILSIMMIKLGESSSTDMGDMQQKAYQQPSLDDIAIEKEEEEDMPDLE